MKTTTISFAETQEASPRGHLRPRTLRYMTWDRDNPCPKHLGVKIDVCYGTPRGGNTEDAAWADLFVWAPERMEWIRVVQALASEVNTEHRIDFDEKDPAFLPPVEAKLITTAQAILGWTED